MTTDVRIVNNPYAQRVKILINGNPPSAYSILDRYLNEPFLYWAWRIFDELDKELNGARYTLHLESSKEQIEILEHIARSYPNCVQFSSRQFVRNTPLTERMSTLSRLLKNNYVQGYHRLTRRALFVLGDGAADLASEIAELGVANCYCEIDSTSVSYKDYCAHPESADVVFLVGRAGCKERLLQAAPQGDAFVLLLAEQTGLLETPENALVFETTYEEFFNTVFHCLILGPLAQLFHDSIAALPDAVSQRYKDQIDVMSSISMRILPRVEDTTIETGHSVSIRFDSDMARMEVSLQDLEFGYSDKGIIRCNGLAVEGLHTGSSTLYIYQKGEKDPCASIPFRVIQRNRVTSLSIEDDDITLGEGDTMELSWAASPLDADNMSEIRWQSDNDAVVQVDANGVLRGVSTGNAYVRLTCERVSTEVMVHVLPYMRDIQIEESEINVYPAGTAEVTVRTIPEVTIDGGVQMAIMDTRFANVVGNQITGFAVGKTWLVVQSRDGRIRKDIPVYVMSERDYNKRLNTRQDRKVGLLERLFG